MSVLTNISACVGTEADVSGAVSVFAQAIQVEERDEAQEGVAKGPRPRDILAPQSKPFPAFRSRRFKPEEFLFFSGLALVSRSIAMRLL